MNDLNLKEIIENLIDTFLHAGKVSLDLREKGLKKEMKADNTPVSNGDLEVNRIITKKLLELTPDIPIVSEGFLFKPIELISLFILWYLYLILI